MGLTHKMGSRYTPMRGIPFRSMQANAQDEDFISPCISLEENGLVPSDEAVKRAKSLNGDTAAKWHSHRGYISGSCLFGAKRLDHVNSGRPRRRQKCAGDRRGGCHRRAGVFRQRTHARVWNSPRSRSSAGKSGPGTEKRSLGFLPCRPPGALCAFNRSRMT